MNWSIVRTLVIKELMIFFRNKFFAVITALGLVFYVAVYLVLPAEADVELEIGLYAADTIPDTVLAAFEARQVSIEMVDSEDDLKDAVEDGDVAAGIFLPDDLMDALAAGEERQITLYTAADSPTELSDAVTVLTGMVFNEISSDLSGMGLNVDVSVEVLGHDLQGESLAVRDRLLPMLAVFALITEMLGMSSLIAEERTARTLQALFMTPMRLREFFMGKGIIGVGLAFGQALFLMLVGGALGTQPVLIILTLLLGAMLVTGLGFLVASAGKDMMSTMGWGMLIFLVLSIPSFGIMFPGTAADWVKLIPSYYLVDTVHQVTNFGAGWSDTSGNLLILSVYTAAIFGLGAWVLQRRLA